jgi:hypothetical protein
MFYSPACLRVNWTTSYSEWESVLKLTHKKSKFGYVCRYHLTIITYWLYILHLNTPLHALSITESFTASCTEDFSHGTIQRPSHTVSSVQIATNSSSCIAYCKIHNVYLPLSREHPIPQHHLVTTRKLGLYGKEHLSSSGPHLCSLSSIFRRPY